MRLDLYQQETERLASDLKVMLDEVCQRLQNAQPLNAQPLTALEQAGVLHALQMLTENAIGKAKLWLKHCDQVVPVSAYDAFAQLHRDQLIGDEAMRNWTAAIGLRNRSLHDYLNVDMAVIEDIIKAQKYQLQVQFLSTPIPTPCA